jgi:hypothetical protein
MPRARKRQVAQRAGEKSVGRSGNGGVGSGEGSPRCGAKILRIRYAHSETNYCASCQTGGRVLADRGLSLSGVNYFPLQATRREF